MTHINLIASDSLDSRRNRAGMGKKCTEKVYLPAFQDVVLLLLLFWRCSCRRCRRSILRSLQWLLILRHKKRKESTSTVRMIIKLKEEDETEFLFSFRFKQFPLNGTLFRLKLAGYLAFCETLHIILMRSQNRYLLSHTGQTCYELHHRSIWSPYLSKKREKLGLGSWYYFYFSFLE